jgi:hypothetical protein
MGLAGSCWLVPGSRLALEAQTVEGEGGPGAVAEEPQSPAGVERLLAPPITLVRRRWAISWTAQLPRSGRMCPENRTPWARRTRCPEVLLDPPRHDLAPWVGLGGPGQEGLEVVLDDGVATNRPAWAARSQPIPNPYWSRKKDSVALPAKGVAFSDCGGQARGCTGRGPTATAVGPRLRARPKSRSALPDQERPLCERIQLLNHRSGVSKHVIATLV